MMKLRILSLLLASIVYASSCGSSEKEQKELEKEANESVMNDLNELEKSLMTDTIKPAANDTAVADSL